MESQELHVVMGAFGYTGKYIARQLLSMGKRVITLTGHPERKGLFGDQVKAFPLSFDKAGELKNNLRGAAVLFNTYWVRFPYGEATFEKAVENTKILLKAAKEADIQRFVHISITNPQKDSSLPYFRGKALVEEAIIQSGLSYAIIRPTVIFGAEDILINNIAWLLRRFPVLAIPGGGEYRLQPIYVEDVAEIAVSTAQQNDNLIVDAAGPEVFTFDGLVRLIAERVHSKARLVHVPVGLALLLASLIGYMVKDVVLTRDEVAGLMKEFLVSRAPPLGQTRFSEWLERNASTAGVRYTSELNRHYRSGAKAGK